MANYTDEELLTALTPKTSSSSIWGLGMSGVSDIFNAFSSLSQGYANASSYNFQAALNEMNAENTMLEVRGIMNTYGRQENVVREAGKRQRGEQVAAMGSSGFSVSSRSFQNILNETDMNIENNIAYVREELAGKLSKNIFSARMQEIQADLNRAAAKDAKKTAKSNAILKGITGLTQIAATGYFVGNNADIDAARLKVYGK